MMFLNRHVLFRHSAVLFPLILWTKSNIIFLIKLSCSGGRTANPVNVSQGDTVDSTVRCGKT